MHIILIYIHIDILYNYTHIIYTIYTYLLYSMVSTDTESYTIFTDSH